MKILTFYMMLMATSAILISSCCNTNKCNVSPEGGLNLTVAQTIEGSFSGSGKYMPGSIKLGTYNTCQEPPWVLYQKSGNATAIVSVVNDSTVNVKLTGSIYSNSFNKIYTVRKNGNVISSADKVVTYYISTKSLNVFLRGSYIATSGCFTGANYFYAFEGLVATPPYKTYIFTSLEVFEFTGTK
ncbi:MAG: hypothetical protein V5804_08680 [Mucilaginibacter sp.]|uniref:hypothetical protein n=1 Tax=Mucilaginibacter sp. TaxID=1882438 RepID=UPI0034E44BE5